MSPEDKEMLARFRKRLNTDFSSSEISLLLGIALRLKEEADDLRTLYATEVENVVASTLLCCKRSSELQDLREQCQGKMLVPRDAFQLVCNLLETDNSTGRSVRGEVLTMLRTRSTSID